MTVPERPKGVQPRAWAVATAHLKDDPPKKEEEPKKTTSKKKEKVEVIEDYRIPDPID